MELHGKELRTAVVGPAAEGTAEVLDADFVGAPLRGLIIDDIAAGALLERPLGVVALLRVKIETLRVGSFAARVGLVRRDTEVSALIFKGIVGAVKMDGEDQCTVACLQTAAGQLGGHSEQAGRDLIVGLLAKANAAVSVVDHNLVAVHGLFAGHGLRADVAVTVGIDRGVNGIELHRKDIGVLRSKAVGAERAVVDLKTGGVRLIEEIGVGDTEAVAERLDLPLGAGAGRRGKARGIGGCGSIVFAAAGQVIGAVVVVDQIEQTGACLDLQRRVLFIGNCGISGGLAVGRFGAHNGSCRGGVNDEGRSRFGNAADRRCGVFFRSSQRSKGQHCENHHRNQQRGDNPLELSFHNFSS